jgi:lipoprotein-releasing system permease protein
MNFSFWVARRYLFSRSKINAINIITGISVFGLTLGAAALILVLSVFNGFEDLITSMYSNFDPDIKVTVLQGKTFQYDESLQLGLEDIEGIEFVSATLEEVAFFDYKDKQDVGILKGVDSQFHRITNIDMAVREGYYHFHEGTRDMAVLGLGMRNKLGVNIDDLFSGIGIYMPKRGKIGPLEPPFRTQIVFPAGTFIVQQEFDQKYILTSLEVARKLLAYEDRVSAIEIGLKPGYNPDRVKQEISKIFKQDVFSIKTRYEQEESFIKLMRIEKWLAFAIAGFMLILIAFNLTGALWMVVLEKKKDISILKALGTQRNQVRNIFLIEGLLLSALGLVMGIMIALVVYGLQKGFGLVSIPGNFIIDAYPASLRFFDFIVVGLTILMIGFFAALFPAIKAEQSNTSIRQE